LVNVTVASGMTAPVESDTCPDMSPNVCAVNIAAGNSTSIKANMQQVAKTLFDPGAPKLSCALFAKSSVFDVVFEF